MGRLNISLPDEMIEELDYNLKINKYKNRSEFIEKALEFYISYLTAHRKSDFLNASVVEGVRQGINDTIRQTMPNIFTLSVELSMLNNLFASVIDISDDEAKDLRKECVDLVRTTKKRCNFENATRLGD